MNPNGLILGLDRGQSDGLACVVCGVDYLRVARVCRIDLVGAGNYWR